MNFRELLLCLSLSLLFAMPSVSTSAEISGRKILRELVQWLIGDIEKSNRMSPEEMEDLNKNLKCELHDLNGDGVPEFLLYIKAYFWCGAGGANCHCWIVQKARKGYKLLLEAMDIRVQDTTTNGYRDLLSVETMWASEEVTNAQDVYVTVYRYDGNRYQEERGYEAFIPFER